MLRSPFSKARFNTVGAIGNAVCNDGVKQLLVKRRAKRGVVLGFEGDQRLKGFERLDCAFEADGAWFDAMLRCSLRHDRSDQIVGQDVRPNLVAHHFRCLASQDLHLHCLLERSEIKLGIPASAIELAKVFLGEFHGVKQCRSNDDRLGSKARLFDSDQAFADQ